MDSDGGRVARFAETFIRQTKGRWAGLPLDLEGWQRDLLHEMFLVDAGRRVYREALVGVPRKNGKSTMSAVIGLYALMASGEPGAEVYSAAASKDQARVVFDQARAFVEGSPALRDWLRPMRNAIVCPSTEGVYRVLSADGGLAHGLNPSCVVIDELHAHRDPELYYALTTGQLARTDPLVVSITTAGFDMDTICRQVYDHGRRLAALGVDAMREAGFLFRWWQAPDGCASDDREAWRTANPSSWIDLDDLAREHERLPEHVFRRLHLNQWVQVEASWLPEGKGMVAERGVSIPEDVPVVLGVDVGPQWDRSAIVTVWQRDDGKYVADANIIHAPGDGRTVDYARIELAILDRHLSNRVRSVAFDKYGIPDLAQRLQHRGVPMVEVPQSNERMVPATQRAYELLTSGQVVFSGDPEFSAHVEACVLTNTERGARVTKRKSKAPNDAGIALVMALAEAANVAPPTPVVEWI